MEKENLNYTRLKLAVSGLAKHPYIDSTYYSLDMIEDKISIRLKYLYQKLSFDKSLAFQVAISNFLSSYGVCYQQVLIYDDAENLTEIDFLLSSVELTKLASIMEQLFN